MKRQLIRDERVIEQERKINSEAYGLCMFVLVVSVAVQCYVFGAPYKQYAVELMCIFGISIYTVVRRLTLGVNLYSMENSKRRPIFGGVFIGLVIMIINGITNYAKYADGNNETESFALMLAVEFVSATIGAFIALSILSYFNTKKQKQIQESLDKEE